MYTTNHARVRHNPRKQFGHRVKELRATQGVTQEELADRVGIFRTYMSRIETGIANPTLTMIHALADALKVPVVALFDAPASVPAPRTRSRQGASRGRAPG